MEDVKWLLGLMIDLALHPLLLLVTGAGWLWGWMGRAFVTGERRGEVAMDRLLLRRED
ncbi:MAG: hypothetical protein HQM03_20855 [Magnetococcales bacterium]|nr:hypothetical protein [Magnetococcales bacterium]